VSTSSCVFINDSILSSINVDSWAVLLQCKYTDILISITVTHFDIKSSGQLGT